MLHTSQEGIKNTNVIKTNSSQEVTFFGVHPSYCSDIYSVNVILFEWEIEQKVYLSNSR